MIIYKVYEKTQFGDSHVTYWLSEDRAEAERQRLIETEVTYIKSSGNGTFAVDVKTLEEYYKVEQITVSE